MSVKIQAIKGMPDILPEDVQLWQKFESLWRKLMWVYGYDEIRFPLVEATSLFKRSIGEVTDIVEKEMFTFSDRDNESITLRPEGTAGCVRAGLQHGLLYNSVQKLWYTGPMFRYERPQKGRYRQFHQVGVEAFGLSGPDIEVEHILLLNRLWKWLGIENFVTLQINSLGSNESRLRYRQVLVEYFSKYQGDLDEESLKRLKTNPLRILDSKNEALANIIQDAPHSAQYLDDQDKKHFDEFQQMLTFVSVPFVVNPRIVRGLDYYNRTVYEWVSHRLGAQNAVAAGGRYDGLVQQLGGENTAAVGFAMGIERLVLLLKEQEKEQKEQEELPSNAVDVYFIAVGENAEKFALMQAEKLRNVCQNLRVLVHCGGGSFKSQFKRADKSGAKVALVLGENEIANQTIGVKFLREGTEQTSVTFENMGHFLNEYFAKERGLVW